MTSPGAPVVVIGGGLPGMAAAARLAALGHEVVLIESDPELGGRWGAADSRADGIAPVITLPAAWRDLFRKTGRTLDVELRSRGWTLEPAAPVVHRFPDETILTMPADRGSQYTALTDAFGRAHADSWRDLIDRLGETWQAVRMLGLERPLADRADAAPYARALLRRTTVAGLARTVPDPLSHLVAASAWRVGSDPRRTPALAASRLAVERDFGRWYVADAAGNALPATALAGVLADRLATRGVDTRTSTAARGLTADGVDTDAGPVAAAAVIVTIHPWHDVPWGAPRRGRLRPALSPRVTASLAPGSVDGVTEDVRHTPAGPVVTYRRQAGTDVLTTVLDHTIRTPDPGAGARWDGWRSWFRRPALRPSGTRENGGPWSATVAAPGGPEPWAQVLTAALAVYDVHETLTGEDVRPANTSYRPRVHRRRAARGDID
jgi:phytoene dehydrogenase-like protein